MTKDNLQEITYLYEIVKALNSTIDLKKSLYVVLWRSFPNPWT